MTFNDRTSYLAARTAWRESYASLTIDIRSAKGKFVEAARQYSKDGNSSPLEFARSHRDHLRHTANEMLSQRQAMKEEAQHQWELSKATA